MLIVVDLLEVHLHCANGRWHIPERGRVHERGEQVAAHSRLCRQAAANPRARRVEKTLISMLIKVVVVRFYFLDDGVDTLTHSSRAGQQSRTYACIEI